MAKKKADVPYVPVAEEKPEKIPKWTRPGKPSKAVEGIDPTKLSLEQMVEMANQSIGTKVVGCASAASLDIRRIPTGIFNLDYGLGAGIPKGRVTGIHGETSSGKTTLAKRTMAYGQSVCRECNRDWRWETPQEWVRMAAKHWATQQGPHGRCLPVPAALWPLGEPAPAGGFDEDLGLDLDDKDAREKLRKLVFGFRGKHFPFAEKTGRDCQCAVPTPAVTVWLDAEAAFDPAWAWANGLWVDIVYVIRAETGETQVDVVDLFLRSQQVDQAVVDSIAQMTPKAEVEQATADTLMAPQARLMNRAFRKWVSAICSSGVDGEYPLTVIVINQMRDKTGVVFGSRKFLPGGNGQKFVTSVDIYLSPGEIHAPAGTRKAKALEEEASDLNKTDASTAKDKEEKEKEEKEAGAGAGKPKWAKTRFAAEKNKTSVAKAEGEYMMYLREVDGRFAAEVDDTPAVIGWAKRMQLITVGETSKDKWKYGDMAESSEPKLVGRILAEGRFRNLRSVIMKRLLGRAA